MLSDVHLLKFFKHFTLVLTLLAVAELVSARIIGRLAFLMMQNPLIALLYNIGITLVWVVIVLVFTAFVWLAIIMLKKNDMLLLPILFLLLALIPVSLLTPSYTYLNTAALLLAVMLYVAKRHSEDKRFIITVSLLALVMLLGIADLLFNTPSFFRYVVEFSIIPASIAVFLFYRKSGEISLGGKLFSVALPLLVFVVPKTSSAAALSSKYTMGIMPWVIRMVSAFSLGFLFLLPLEVYAVVLALVLLTIFRIRRREPLAAYGLVLLIVAGLPSWSIYPLLISTLGFLLITLPTK